MLVSDVSGPGGLRYDPTAVIEITNPRLFVVRNAPVAVTLAGDAAGRTRLDPAGSGPLVRVCMGVDAEAVRARFLGIIGGAEGDRRPDQDRSN